MLLPRSLRFTRLLRGLIQLRSLHQPPRQTHHLSRCREHLLREASYCVTLTLRRLCSTQDAAEPKKRKRAKKGEPKGKKQSASDETEPLDGETDSAKKRSRKSKGEGKKKTQAELLADHVAREPAAVQELLQHYDTQLNKTKHDPEMFYIVNQSVAGRSWWRWVLSGAAQLAPTGGNCKRVFR